MIRAVVWKEFREQGLIALTLIALASGLLAALAAYADPRSLEHSGNTAYSPARGLLAALMLAVTAGTVCGGALFAAEREAGTMGFLDSLPTSRMSLWIAKMVAGAILAIGQIGLVIGIASILGLVGSLDSAIGIALYAFLAFVWGAFGSTLARTTLGSVGLAIPSSILAAIFFLIPVMIFFSHSRTQLPNSTGILFFMCCMLCTPLALSFAAFTHTDRDRLTSAFAFDRSTTRQTTSSTSPPPSRLSRQPSSWFGLKSLIWLACRQLYGIAAAASGFALLMGLVLLLPNIQPVLYWLPLSLVAGTLAGVTMFADEQSKKTRRFWAERRLPISRAWLIKLGIHFLFAFWLLALLALPSALRYQTSEEFAEARGHGVFAGVFRSLLLDQIRPYALSYLLLPMVYGFAAGHLCGLLFRKLLVAAGVAGLVGGTLAAFWIPSLLAGGLNDWQLWLPPAAAILTARLLVRPWSADRLTRRGPLGILTAGILGIALLMTSGIAWRILEVPNEPGAEDDLSFVAGLPILGENEGVREFRAAADRFARVAGRVTPLDQALSSPGFRQRRVEDRAESVPYQKLGWPADDPELQKWLDRLYQDVLPEELPPWFAEAERAASSPTGIYEDPRQISFGLGPVERASLYNARRMGEIIVVRGLQQQVRGQPAAFLTGLRTALALERDLRDRSIVVSFLTGLAVEKAAIFGVDRWLERLDGRPDLLREALSILQQADANEPFDPTPHMLAGRYVLREGQKAPGQWLTEVITRPEDNREEPNTEIDLVEFSWAVPWERERTRRLLGLGFEAGLRPGAEKLVQGRPGAGLFLVRSLSPQDLTEADCQARAYLRAVILKVSIRLYMHEHGAAPASLEELLKAGYLKTIPTDPYDGKLFRYRVSAGELVSAPGATQGRPGEPEVKIEPGQAVLWSVGPNRTDEGGRQPPTAPGNPSRPEDLVFPVPLQMKSAP